MWIINKWNILKIAMHEFSIHSFSWTLLTVNVSVGCKHSWMNNSNSSVVQSVCTLCNRCCGNEGDCPWNGIIGEYLRQSGCCADTSGCQSCGICIPCAREMWVCSQTFFCQWFLVNFVSVFLIYNYENSYYFYMQRIFEIMKLVYSKIHSSGF